MFQARGDGGAAAVLGQRQFGHAPADVARVHDLVSLALFQNAVLVNAAAVGEGVQAHDGLAALHDQPAHAGDELGRLHNLPRIHIAVHLAQEVAAGLDGHDVFFEGGVAGAFADAIDGALDLAGAGADGGQGVGHGEAEIVVAMHADDGLAGLKLAHFVMQMLDQGAELIGHGPAHRVGNVHRGRASRHDGPADLDEKVRFRARAVFGREFHVVHEGLGPLHAIDGEAEDFVLHLAEFELAVEFRGGEEDVDAGAFACGFDSGAGGVDILGHAAGEAGDDRAFDFAGDGLDGGEVPLAGDGEPGLDHVHLEAGELAGDPPFFAPLYAGAGGFAAVHERRVEYDDAVVFHMLLLWL